MILGWDSIHKLLEVNKLCLSLEYCDRLGDGLGRPALYRMSLGAEC